jgi:hypothetical protein
MLQVARLAPSLLAEAGPLVLDFIQGQFNEDGGAMDRSGKSDLYYTPFALDGLIAMGVEPDSRRTLGYLTQFGSGEELDIVHRACLARCYAALKADFPTPNYVQDTLTELERHRSEDGGYAAAPGAATGTLYHSFLALGAYQDLGQKLPFPAGVGASFEGLRTPDGAYANALDLKLGTTPSTAAACAAMGQLELHVPPEVGPWLLAQQHAAGGFMAMPEAPMPDLLSTATALHALSSLRMDVGKGHELALDFMDSLWTGRAFCGHWADDEVDVEYTFYALLALGHLSVGV